jgi:hypothetical protein
MKSGAMKLHMKMAFLLGNSKICVQNWLRCPMSNVFYEISRGVWHTSTYLYPARKHFIDGGRSRFDHWRPSARFISRAVPFSSSIEKSFVHSGYMAKI